MAPMAANVRADVEVVDYNGYLIGKSGKGWRVYEDATEYNARSGQVMMKGPVMRDMDGAIITFKTQALAETWVDGGCMVYEKPIY